MKNVNYSSSEVPKDYKCKLCGATNCRLWRDYGSFSPRLLCLNCTEKDQNKRYDPTHKRYDPTHPHDIGWFCFAIPDEEGIGYWDYTSVPTAGIKWWERLSISPSTNKQ